MRYVLDSNVALKWVLAEPDSPKANQLRYDFRNGVHEHAPQIYPGLGSRCLRDIAVPTAS